MGKNHKGPVGVNITKGQNAMQRIEARLRAEYDVKQQFSTDFLLQVCCDAFLLAASDVFQCGAGRAWKAIEAYRMYVNQIMDNLIEDSRGKNGDGDNELLFFWTDLDRRLKQIVGKEKFTPHDERYDETGMKLFEGLFQRYMGRRLIALKEANKVRAEKEEPEEGGGEDA